MRHVEQLSLIWSFTLAVMLALPAAGFAQAAGGETSAVSGKDEYQQFCSPCHGMDGRGERARFSIASKLWNKPTDLTLLAHYNHGVFPEKEVKAVVDGTKAVGPHGAREMPIWGREFSSLGSSPEQAQARINAIADYIKSIQEK